jgi:hypothetical protein
MATYCLNLLRSRSSSRARIRLRGPRDEVLRAFRLHRRASTASAARGRLWHEEDGFYFDALKLPTGRRFPDRAPHGRGIDPAPRDRGRSSATAAPVPRLRVRFHGSPSTARISCTASPTSLTTASSSACAAHRRFGQAAAHPGAHARRGRDS